ncbi:MAG TPA: hypothetical protein VN665_00560 [Candidatus Paceibacterota bacterium]|nr:hypothetical protein [Candidatus Paceibacterota bacterium]
MARATLEIAAMLGGITTPCPQCGRQHVTVFKLRHLKDAFFHRLGEFYAYADHTGLDNETCTNSGKSPNWGGPAKPPSTG